MSFLRSLRATLALCLISLVIDQALFLSRAWAHDEPYSSRPDILAIAPIAHPEFGSFWQKAKLAHVEVLAELIESYPEYELYFLGRDAEYLFDTAKVLVSEEPHLIKRLHLMNVSRTSMKSEHLLEYLEFIGLNTQSLEVEGKKALLIDTGFYGTISDRILEVLPKKLHSRLRTHLLASANSRYPSSSVFFRSISKKADWIHPASLHRLIVQYESFPHYTHRALEYQFIDSRWEPVGRELKSQMDGRVSRDQAVRLMEDLKAFGAHPAVQELFLQRRAFWRGIREKLEVEEKIPLQFQLLGFLSTDDPMRFSMIRDLYDWVEKNVPEKLALLPSFEDFGVKPLRENRFLMNNKAYLIETHPEWVSFLQDPEFTIPSLVKEGDDSVLFEISNLIRDDDVEQIIAQCIADFGLRSLLTHIVKLDRIQWHHALAAHSFSTVRALPWLGELRALLIKGDDQTLELLAEHVFSKSHSLSWRAELGTLMRRRNLNVLETLSKRFFSQPAVGDFELEAIYAIENGNEQTWENFAWFVFLQDHTRDWKRAIISILKRVSDSGVLSVLSGASYFKMKDEDRDRAIILKSLNIKDPALRVRFLDRTLR